MAFASQFAGLKIASLEELLCKFARHCIFNLRLNELGSDPVAAVQILLKLLRIYDHSKHVYFSGNKDVIKLVKSVAPQEVCCLSEDSTPYEIIELAVALQCNKAEFALPHLTKEAIDKVHSQGLKCVIKCDDPLKAPEYFQMGIDTILTCDYWHIAQALKSKA